MPDAELHDRLGSTNDRALELLATDAPDGTVIVAREQTQGRGRRGTPWASAPDLGVWMSVLRRGEVGAVVPLRVGLAVSRALDPWAPPGACVRIKWPNDLFVRGRKVGGILCEARAGGCALGLGLDVMHQPLDFPEHLRPTASSLVAQGWHVPSPATLIPVLAQALVAVSLDDRLGPEELEVFGDRDALRGRRIRDAQGREGEPLGLTPDGGLRVGNHEDTWTVVAGSIQTLED